MNPSQPSRGVVVGQSALVYRPLSGRAEASPVGELSEYTLQTDRSKVPRPYQPSPFRGLLVPRKLGLLFGGDFVGQGLVFGSSGSRGELVLEGCSHSERVDLLGSLFDLLSRDQPVVARELE